MAGYVQYLFAQPNASAPVTDLAVTVTGPSTVIAGAQVVYDVAVTNNGPLDATNVKLVDFIPNHTCTSHDTWVVSETQTSGPSFECGGGDWDIICTRSTLSSGASATFNFVLRVNSREGSSYCVSNYGAQLTNAVQVFSTTLDSNPANDEAVWRTTAIAQADVSVSKSGPATARPDEPIVYTILVTNNGPSDADGVLMTDELPAEARFISVTGTTQMGYIRTGFTCTTPPVGGTGTVLCTLPYMGLDYGGGAGTWGSFEIAMQMGSVPLSDTATVSSSTTDPIVENNSATATTNISGDLNGDGFVSAADAVYLINFLFAGGGSPAGAGDVDGDGVATVADIFYLINYLFAAGPPPR